MVRKGGLEPPWAAPLEPKSSASTNSATFAAAFAERASIADTTPSLPARDRRPRRSASVQKRSLIGAIAPLSRVRRPLRKFSGRLGAAPPGAAAGRGGDLPLRAQRRRPRRRGRRCRPRERLAALRRYERAIDAIGERLHPRRRRRSRTSRAAIARHDAAARRRSATSRRRSARTSRPRATPTSSQLQDYCRRSANPVGRLLLHLYGAHTPANVRVERRDLHARCSSSTSGRTWRRTGSADASTCRRRISPHYGVTEDDIGAGRCGAPWRALMDFEVTRARAPARVRPAADARRRLAARSGTRRRAGGRAPHPRRHRGRRAATSSVIGRGSGRFGWLVVARDALLPRAAPPARRPST